jgi:outer membrane protein assembly factor BamB
MLPLALAAPFLLALTAPRQSDWPHLRGPRLDGTATTDGKLGAGEVGLRVAWKRALGPAYSGVAVADGLAVTTYSDGEVDRVIAVDARTGAERWSHALEPTYLGHDGSEDGPIASPVIGGGRAFVISARGKLVALALSDGQLAWSRDLPAELGSVVPEYGFGSTPLLEGAHLIVQAGGTEGRYLCAFDAATGALAWSVGDGELQYGSPIAMDLAGRRQVVVLAGKKILGVAPESGALLWEHVLPGERDSAQNGVATPMDGDGERFFANVSGAIAIFRVTRAGDGFAVEEQVRVRELGRTYAAPVYAEGRLWGFKNEFLTCCDATTGERLWKSRPPGGRGLILVDDRLVVFGAQGLVALVDTDAADYRELASVTALESTGYVWPSFADGRVYLRNATELACVELVPAPSAAVAASSAAAERTTPETSVAAQSDFGGFLREVALADDRAERVAAFLAEGAAFPVQEPGLVHFLFQGDAQDVAIAGSMIDESKSDALTRIAGTDLWHRSYALEPGARFEYRFQVDFGDWIADPRNPRTVPGGAGPPLSEVVTREYVERTHFLPRSDGPRGRLEPLEYASAALGSTRELQVYLPAGYDAGDAAYPLLLVHEGADWLASGGLANTLDNLSGTRMRPVIAVFIPALPEWWFEGGGTGTEEYVDALAGELVPFLAERYRISPDAQDRALFGKESFGLTAILGALRHPETFGKAGVLSLFLGDVARHAIFALLAEEPSGALAFFVGWNRYESRNQDRGYDQRAESARMAELLRASGHSVAGGEFLDASGWGSWRAHTEELLTALFPVE